MLDRPESVRRARHCPIMRTVARLRTPVVDQLVGQRLRRRGGFGGERVAWLGIAWGRRGRGGVDGDGWLAATVPVGTPDAAGHERARLEGVDQRSVRFH